MKFTTDEENKICTIETDLVSAPLEYVHFIEPFPGHASISLDWNTLAAMGIKEAEEVAYVARRALLAAKHNPASPFAAGLVRIVPTGQTNAWANLTEEQAAAVRRLGESHVFAAEDMKHILAEKAALEERDRLETEAIELARQAASAAVDDVGDRLVDTRYAELEWNDQLTSYALGALREREEDLWQAICLARRLIGEYETIAYQPVAFGMSAWTPASEAEQAARDARLAQAETKRAADEQARLELDAANQAALDEANAHMVALLDVAMNATDEEAAQAAREREKLETSGLDASPPELRPDATDTDPEELAPPTPREPEMGDGGDDGVSQR